MYDIRAWSRHRLHGMVSAELASVLKSAHIPRGKAHLWVTGRETLLVVASNHEHEVEDLLRTEGFALEDRPGYLVGLVVRA